jgi:phosphohistidine phosphatase
MRLYVLRHAKAERHSDSGRDEDRPLADRGRAQADGLAKLFSSKSPPKHLSPRPTQILSSPAVRADQTAQILAQALNVKVRAEDALSLDATLKDVLDLVEGLADNAEPVLIVGHNPLLSRLIDHLTGADDLRTGELSVLDLDTLSDVNETARYRCDQ